MFFNSTFRARHLLIFGIVFLAAIDRSPAETVEMDAETLRDKIRGGLLGQILGNLNGLPHEMRYINEPGNVTNYVPALPEGAWTDDDTDFEWVYILAMQRENTIQLPPSRIAQLWKERINQRIWCSNQYARQLMDLGLEPPLTGNVLLNPWADFNISGQFLCETFGLLAPGMPQTAARIGLNYTRVAIDGEPAQTTQLFTTMIATAFLTDDLERILSAGIAALDPPSVIRLIAKDVASWHRQHPAGWRTTRLQVKEKYSHHQGAMRDKNGYELNTASTLAALLYGEGDFAKTLQYAFNFGWDCDNNAATAGTIVGVIKGYRWMMSQGWQIVDRYRNETREAMPLDETMTSFADRLIDLAERVISENGGGRRRIGAQMSYTIKTEPPANVAPLLDKRESANQLLRDMRSQIEDGVKYNALPKGIAQSAYLAICLGLDVRIREESPEVWKTAIQALESFPHVVQALYYHSPVPAGEALRKKAIAAGLKKPPEKRDLW